MCPGHLAGSTSRSPHQVSNTFRLEAVWVRDSPVKRAKWATRTKRARIRRIRCCCAARRGRYDDEGRPPVCAVSALRSQCGERGSRPPVVDLHLSVFGVGARSGADCRVGAPFHGLGLLGVAAQAMMLRSRGATRARRSDRLEFVCPGLGFGIRVVLRRCPRISRAAVCRSL